MAGCRHQPGGPSPPWLPALYALLTFGIALASAAWATVVGYRK